MRLTKKAGNTYQYNFDTNCDFETRDQRSIETHNKIVNKLGQLEDIEDELGIDLILYLKVMTKRYIYIKGKEPEWADNGADKNTIEKYYVVAFNKYWIEVKYTNNCDQHSIENPLKCYGKTWALTKEELEDGKTNSTEKI